MWKGEGGKEIREGGNISNNRKKTGLSYLHRLQDNDVRADQNRSTICDVFFCVRYSSTTIYISSRRSQRINIILCDEYPDELAEQFMVGAFFYDSDFNSGLKETAHLSNM